jgi:folate-binding protein YgfZ
LAQPLAAKLGIYKLRAKVAVENLSEGPPLSESEHPSLGVLAVWDGEPAIKPDLWFEDPRAPGLGFRLLVPAALAAKAADLIGAELTEPAAYDAHRIAIGVPSGGVDFGYGDAFPHESNMDRLHGVDFDKGCYVGQEVVSRMQHRGTARTRTIRLLIDGPAPQPGTAILAGDKTVGTLGSTSDRHALALLRIDRAADALQAGLPMTAAGIPVTPAEPDDPLIVWKQTVA